MTERDSTDVTPGDSGDPVADDRRRERARGSLLGLACGDALGRPVDGSTAAAVRERHGRVTELLGGDRPAGTTTDATATAVAAGHARLDGYRSDNGSHEVPDGDRDAHADRVRPEDPAILLAGVPAGLGPGAPAERAEAAARAVRTVVSGDVPPEPIAGAVVLAVVVGAFVDGASVEEARADARTVALDRDAPVSVRETIAVVGDRGAVRIDAGGDPRATLETALHEALVADDPEEAIVSAASRGGAASALGAVAGAVAGARDGEAAVPARWLNELDGAPDLRRLADALVEDEGP
ncbi:ADP-ribosylglycohydrolase family protein [Halobaculum sp. CBA1158]|uniref:ADP-ribosylglycohydrolase family protein n=1 Tax=Halobaculum sp. CBA1158 TaxID=2904243 RepID=UPI001F16733C|nr:ADP-ribosylglycohydrolase family protein [Halobaculum sp. CBA1158]UIO99060.1 ADP-ribosylglycohydrolase family protein [Halobaculum sp. CBA1158]